MRSVPHHIRRQRWLVKAPSTAAAFAIRQQLRMELDTVLLPVFDRVFDALGASDEVVHIPQLAISLTANPDGDLWVDLAQALGEQLAAALDKAVGAAPGIRRVPAPLVRREVLLNYLSSGQLDWHVDSAGADSVLAILRTEAEACAADLPKSLGAGHRPLEQRAAIAFRLLQLLAPATRSRLVDRLAPPMLAPASPPSTPKDAAAALQSLLRRLASPDMVGEYLSLRVQSLLIALNGEPLARPLAPAVTELLLECRAQGNLDRTTARVLDASLALLARDPESPAAPDAPTGAGRADEPEAVTEAVGAHIAALSALARHGTGRILTEDHALVTHDAGLVLLHPFLPRLFEALGILTPDMRTIGEAGLPRAAALLHWLLSGRADVFEFELATIKVLLGLAPEHPLTVARGLLADTDTAEADHMLAAVIGHWPALGKTSPAGLRSSFLQRRGALREIAEGWQLQVEPQSFDVLLGRLPWGIGIVKLPWMTRPLFTEWH